MNFAPAISDRALNDTWQDSRSYDSYTLHCASADQLLALETQEWIKRGLIESLPNLKVADYFRVKAKWFSEYDYLIIAVERQTGQLIAALASRWHKADAKPVFLHITVQLIADRFRRTHLLKRMWGFHFQQVSRGPFGVPSIIALRTYNPVVYTAMRIFTRIEGVKLYPQLDADEQDPAMIEIAKPIAARICPNLEVCFRTGAVRGASVPPDFYPALPKSNKTEVYSYFEKNLTAADRLLCILSIPTDSARQRLLRAFGT